VRSILALGTFCLRNAVAAIALAGNTDSPHTAVCVVLLRVVRVVRLWTGRIAMVIGRQVLRVPAFRAFVPELTLVAVIRAFCTDSSNKPIIHSAFVEAANFGISPVDVWRPAGISVLTAPAWSEKLPVLALVRKNCELRFWRFIPVLKKRCYPTLGHVVQSILARVLVEPACQACTSDGSLHVLVRII